LRVLYRTIYAERINAVRVVSRFLAAGGEAAIVGDGDAEILVGIHRGVVDAHFVMEVRTDRPLAPT
jgi:hypothetical protein